MFMYVLYGLVFPCPKMLAVLSYYSSFGLFLFLINSWYFVTIGRKFCQLQVGCLVTFLWY